ncbi:hypothetical protein FPSE_05757 [Fusarium pseudograminearum CS3096]|uniref:Uncharacterized protein n=1 Tax=Fusarium pseudograminearum (strain CS3096) TaxID=1028729 RepID=K3UP15_FUSPC|nr:hypothetical protein FPSE_05757 [Fusarium pseudograminearum CS3096]EKJ74066.1 hypothetical protein FPSE_05757 [Fusarium pseudograminearum CS3096]
MSKLKFKMGDSAKENRQLLI